MSLYESAEQFERVLLVGVGGFAGSTVRYLVELRVQPNLSATFTVNVLGCLILGFLVYTDLYGGTLSQRTRLLAMTGFISSFTTYSTFVLDTLTSAAGVGLAYLFASYAVGFGAVLVGRSIAVRRYAGPQETHP